METLSSRERVEKALEHEEPDRVPMDLGGFQSGITVLAYEKLKEKLGIRRPTRLSERNQQLAVVDEEVLQEFGLDMRYVFPRSPSSWDPREIETPHSQAYIDEWGVRWEKTPHQLLLRSGGVSFAQRIERSAFRLSLVESRREKPLQWFKRGGSKMLRSGVCGGAQRFDGGFLKRPSRRDEK
jgi:hypothetical protein